MRTLWVLGLFGFCPWASAQDADDNGCVDAREVADSACLSPQADAHPSLIMGTGARVEANSTVGPDVVLSPGVTIATYATVAGRGIESASSTFGERTVISRRAVIGSDAQLGADNVVGRGAVSGTHLSTGDDVIIGFGAMLGDHITLGSSAAVGALVDVGDWTELGDDAVLARGARVLQATGPGQATVINGVVGPEVEIGAGAFISASARIRKNASIGAGAQLLGNARVGRDAQIGPRAIIEDGAVVRGGVTVCNDTSVPVGVYLARGDVYPAEGCPCEPGYEGLPGACEDIDECAVGSDTCGANTDCLNLPGSFECSCQSGFVENVDGDCVPISADVDGDFSPDLSNQAPNTEFTAGNTVTVTGFTGSLDIDVQTTGSGPAAVVQRNDNGSWTPTTSVQPGDELRLVMLSAPANGSARTATVRLFRGPTTAWTSSGWSITTWTYSATNISYGACSATCGGGSQSPVSWTCNRSDGTTGHAQGNCSGGGSQSCGNGSCPWNVRTNGQRITIRDPLTNADRYDIRCRNGGNGTTDVYTTMSVQLISSNAINKEVIGRAYISGGREAYFRVLFSGNANLSVSSWSDGISGRHGYFCRTSSTSTSACAVNGGSADPFNCSSYLFCQVRDRNQGTQSHMYQSRTTTNPSADRAITFCGGGTPAGNYLAPVSSWLSW